MVRPLSHQQQADQRKPAGTEQALKPFLKAEVSRVQRSLVINTVRPLPEGGHNGCDGSNGHKELDSVGFTTGRYPAPPAAVTARRFSRLGFHTVPALSGLPPQALRSPHTSPTEKGARRRLTGREGGPRSGGAGPRASAAPPTPGSGSGGPRRERWLGGEAGSGGGPRGSGPGRRRLT